MSLFYFAILQALRSGEKPEQIYEQMIKQGNENPRLMMECLLKDMTTMMATRYGRFDNSITHQK